MGLFDFIRPKAPIPEEEIQGRSPNLLDMIAQLLPSQSYEFNNPNIPQATPAPTPTPTPTPTQNTYSIPEQAVGIPDNPNHPGFSNQTRNIEPNLFDAISGSDTTDKIKRLMFALGASESSGGYNLTGDSGNAHGPYHINQLYRGDVPGQRNPISIEDSMNQESGTRYLLEEILRNQDAGSPFKDLLSSWNSKSGYVNSGPRYNEELPLMATTSAFLKGE